MRNGVFTLAALAAPLVSARPQADTQGATSTTQVELYTPIITTINPFSAQEDGPDVSEEIVLRCETFGPQCMTFPRGSSENETISVRVYCAAALLKPRHRPILLPPPLPKTGTRHRPPHVRYALVPSMMNPCPNGALCTVTIDESKRPPGLPPPVSPPPEVDATLPSDAWLWFENEEGVVPALAGEDMSAWAKLNWLDKLANLDIEEEGEEEEEEEDSQDVDVDDVDEDDTDDDDNGHDDQDVDDDGDKDRRDEADHDGDDDGKHGSYDGFAGLDIEAVAGPELLVLTRPRIPPLPRIPWFKFTCFVEDDTEPPPVI
ncbi:hypothetical protein F5B17DRAFT_375896 [Nemania serpens]|nr:hypothetical protein F5B17DRAFT_375896 [Nemania serpens]